MLMADALIAFSIPPEELLLSFYSHVLKLTS